MGQGWQTLGAICRPHSLAFGHVERILPGVFVVNSRSRRFMAVSLSCECRDKLVGFELPYQRRVNFASPFHPPTVESILKAITAGACEFSSLFEGEHASILYLDSSASPRKFV